MAITTRIAPFYGGQKIFACLLCAVFGVWGAYDYFAKIPKQELVFTFYTERKAQLDAFEAEAAKLKERGLELSETQKQNYAAAKDEVDKLAPGGAAPVKPSKFNRITQWVYMACLPCAPYFLWLFVKAKKQTYTLDDEGTLHFMGDPTMQSGQWKRDEIADIDMNRWMAKSIAYAVHRDGKRLMLDAYLHKNLHLIIGALASRYYPNQWDIEAKQIKPASESEAGGAGSATGDEPVSSTARE